MGCSSKTLFGVGTVFAIITYSIPAWIIIDQRVLTGFEVRLGQGIFGNAVILSSPEELDSPDSSLFGDELSDSMKAAIAMAVLAILFSFGAVGAQFLPTQARLATRVFAVLATLTSFLTWAIYAGSDEIKAFKEACDFIPTCEGGFSIEVPNVTIFPYFAGFFLGVIHSVFSAYATFVVFREDVA